MAKEIIPAKEISGSIAAPPSKAHTLRAIIISSLAAGRSVLHDCLIAEDQEYAISAMRALGAKINFHKKTRKIVVSGVDGSPTAPEKDIFIGNSGLTARFLVSIAGLAKGKEVVIDGVERMRTGRPIADLLEALAPLGVEAISINGNGCPPIKVKPDSFEGGATNLAGDKSSQYFSSILIAAPYAKKDVVINTVGKLSSKPYIDVTIDSMREFGVLAENENYRVFRVKSGQRYSGRQLNTEGDFSSAAYFFVAAAICGGKVRVSNLKADSKQGDKFFVELMEKMGCKVVRGDDWIELEGAKLKGLGGVDMNDFPDIVMPLAIAAAFARGETKITNVEHLRIKESDRLSVTVEELKKLGADASCGKDFLLVKGDAGKRLHGAVIDSHGDHRIAMSFAVAGLKVNGVKISGEDAVSKSFPDFFEQLEKIVKR